MTRLQYAAGMTAQATSQTCEECHGDLMPQRESERHYHTLGLDGYRGGAKNICCPCAKKLGKTCQVLFET